MITLIDVKDWLKNAFPAADHYYCGKLDGKKEKSIGVYQRRPSGLYRVPLGGIENKSYEEKDISILLHWNKYSGETEKMSFALFDAIQSVDTIDLMIGAHKVAYIRMDTPEPIDVGTDDNGVYERVIWIKIYYNKQEG